jgi:hypothetical protein
MKTEEAAVIGSYLSFSLFAFNTDELVSIPGTGFLIAPRLALTAKHVSDEIFRRLAIPIGGSIPRIQTYFEGMEIRAAQQAIGAENSDLMPWWHVAGAFDSKLTDISLLKLFPGNEAAHRADERHAYPRWSLSPPVMNQKLWAFGYAMETLERETPHPVTFINVNYIASVEPLTVTAIFEQGRREEPLDVPNVLGVDQPLSMFDYPSFEVRGELTASMSGGPVFDDDALYGVISTGWRSNPEAIGGPLEAAGTVALLRPLLEMPEVSLDKTDPPTRIANLIESARFGRSNITCFSRRRCQKTAQYKPVRVLIELVRS